MFLKLKSELKPLFIIDYYFTDYLIDDLSIIGNEAIEKLSNFKQIITSDD